ncbi:RHS repeat-associated core domain-containing protein, partial [Haliangium sp.]|uniref:RHS repeat-associated core domain-containing protein n=1 Tax=Haliangium sp. TaxID=2663208 RepID=UPI003D0CEB27
HGFYDSREKRFRGFERSESRLLSDASQEAGLTVSEYDVGFDDVYFNGRLRSQTVYSGLDEAGKPLQTQRMEYDECALAEVPTTGLAFPVRSICMTGQTTIAQEGAAEAEWVTLRSEYDYDDYGNAIAVRELGVVHRGPPEAAQACAPCARDESVFGAACGATCTGDESFTEIDYIAPGAATGGRWILGRAVRERRYGVAGGAAGGETSEVTTYYDGPDFVGLPAGQLDEGLVTRVEARVRAGSDETIALVRNRYDQHGNVIETMDPNGSLERANSHRRVREYDGLGLNLRRTELLLEDDDGPYRLRQEFGYEPLFNKVSESTATMLVVGGEVKSARNSRFYRYDAFGRLHQLIRPGDSQDAPSMEVAYELADPATAIITRRRSQAGGELDIESIRCLDGRGREIQRRTRLAEDSYQVTGFTEYNKRGAAVRIFEPYLDSSSACATRPPGDEVLVTQFRYDALGRNLESVHADAGLYGEPSRQRTEYAPLATLRYDPEDNDPQSPYFDTPVVHRNDGLGRAVAIERHLDAAGAAPTIELHYDGLGRLRGYRDPAGNVKTQQYDLLGRVLSVDDPNAGVTGYEYDPAGNVIVRRDGRGVVTRTRYDGANRPLERWDDGDRDGSLVRYRYDRAEVCSDRRCTNVEGRLAEVLYPVDLGDGPTVGRDQFGFDVRGRQVYQARVLFGHEFAIERSFDNADRLVRALYPDGQELLRSYDGASRLVGIDGVLDRVAYDARGQLEHIEYGNGTSTWHSYDDVMRLSELVTLGSDGQVLQGFAYERDRAGNIESIADLSAPQSGQLDAGAAFTYDPWYRLLTAELGAGADRAPEVMSYRYDDIDNVLSANSSLDVTSAAHVGEYAYDSARPNAVVQAGGRHRGYDAAGHVLERGGQLLRWDHLDRLIGAQDASGVPVAHFAYGANQERVAKREAGTLSLYIAPEFEVRDGISVLYARVDRDRVARLQSDALATALLSDLAPLDGGENRPDGRITAADAWVASLSGEAASTGGAVPHSAPDALLRASARRLLMAADEGAVYLHGDHMGSLTAATDEQGRLSGRRWYEVSGDERRASGYIDHYGFTGQERDDSTGLLHFQYRYLDTETGRWLSPDPLFATLSPELVSKLGESTVGYGYVANNPVNYIDPTGLYKFILGLWGEPTYSTLQTRESAKNYNDLVNDGTVPFLGRDSLPTKIRNAMVGADSIVFNLTGMKKQHYRQFLRDRAAPGYQPTAGSDLTNWELHTVLNDPTLLAKTTFVTKRFSFNPMSTWFSRRSGSNLTRGRPYWTGRTAHSKANGFRNATPARAAPAPK